MRARQRGAALLIMVVIMVLGASFLVLRSLNASTMRADRYRITQDALIRAKEGLIARAVLDDNRPGSLPCPDLDDDGDAEIFAGIQCPSYIGRLPWRTLGLPDLRDASGERLWYALSPSHRDHASAQPINSSTPGLLSVVGTQPAAGMAALIFAPGAVVARAGAASTQSRGCTVGVDCDANLRCTLGVATPKCNPANYLEVSGGVDNADGNTAYVSAIESESFNDRPIEVTVDDIMWLVEKRAGRELGGKLRSHFDTWRDTTAVVNTKGFYPWAAPFNDPATASPGVNATSTGQLPMSEANVVWSAPVFPLGACVGAGTTQITCSGVLACALGCISSMTARVEGIGTAFIDPPNGSEVTITGVVIGGVASWTLNPAAQALDFSFGGNLIAVGLVEITVNLPMTSSWTTSATEWLVANSWSQVSHYSVSPDFALNGTNACAGACISVANAANKEAVVTMTGRALAGQARIVPAALDTYLEGGNQDPTDLLLERGMKTPAFNDQPVVVRP